MEERDFAGRLIRQFTVTIYADDADDFPSENQIENSLSEPYDGCVVRVEMQTPLSPVQTSSP